MDNQAKLKGLWCFILCLVFLNCFCGQTQAKGWAVLVGIDNYHSPEISSLSGAVNDANAMADTFHRVFDIPEKNILVYTSAETETQKPTTGRIVKALKYVAQNAAPDDLFVFAFSGHGISKHKKSYLLTYYSEMGALEYTALSIDELNEVMATIKSEKRLLIMDACRNNPERGKGDSDNLMSEIFSKGIGITQNTSNKSSRVIASMFSCDIGQRSYEWADKKRGYFSYFLESGLKGKAADSQGRVTLGSLSGYLRNSVPDALRRSLGVDKNQQPYVVMEGGDPASWVLSEIGKKDWEAEVSRRQNELSRLEQYEAEQQKSKNQIAEEDAAYQQKLAEMDQQITKMQKRLGTSSARSSDSLDAMLAMIDQKEVEQKKMDALKKKREAEKKQRQLEMKRLQAEKHQKKMDSFKEDVEKYKKIIASPYGKDLSKSAWNQLAAAYPEVSEGVAVGDIEQMQIALYKLMPFVNDVGIEFVYIEPSSFMMGSPTSESVRDRDETEHRVTLTRGYYLQTTEVTQGQWRSVMENNPSHFKNCGDDCPVESVSWDNVQEFIKKLNQRKEGSKYRLPTEAEWEYACRAGSDSQFNTGSCLSSSQANYNGNYPFTGCSKGQSRQKTMQVGSFSANAWGLHDMHGNVWEWCSDWYGENSSGSKNDPPGPSFGDRRILRGGSWDEYARKCRSAYRGRDVPGFQDYSLGFRLVMLIPH